MTKVSLACLAVDGSKVLAESFTERKMYQGTVPNDAENMEYVDVKDIDNGSIHEWYVVGTAKYGRNMYCPKTNILRTQTKGEFHGKN